MKLRMILFISFYFTQISAFANVVCDKSSLGQSSVYSIPGAGYWLQASGKCRITYTSFGGLNSSMYNYCEGKSEPINNAIDAFPIPGFDEELYVQPGPIRFFKFFEDNVPKFTENNWYGNYQSVGLLKDDGAEKTIRIAMGKNSGTIKDYKIKFDNGKFSIHAVQPKEILICQNVGPEGLDSQIPILSRNGEMIAARDYQTNNTYIYQIGPSYCVKVADLGIKTSKVSFSFDNRSVVFVQKDPQTKRGRLMHFDIDSGKTATLSGPKEDVKYATHRKDDLILYTRSLWGADIDSQIGVDLGKTQISNGPGEDTTNQSGETAELVLLNTHFLSNKDQGQGLRTLGRLWGLACSQTVDEDQALLIGARMRKDVCLSLAASANLKRLKEEYSADVDKEEILNVCAKKTVENESGR